MTDFRIVVWQPWAETSPITRLTRLGVALLLLAVAFAGDNPADAVRDQSPGDLRDERAQVQAEAAQAAADINALEAEHAAVAAALADLEANVAAHEARLADSERALGEAEEEVDRLESERDAVRDEMARVEEALTEMAVESFIRPSSDDFLMVIQADEINDVAKGQAYLDMQAGRDIDYGEQLDGLEEELAYLEAEAEAARDRAEEERDEVAARLVEVEAARDQQRQFVADVERRLDDRLMEAQILQERDSELAAEIQRQEAALAAQLAASGVSGGSSASLVPVTGPEDIVNVRGIQVHESIAAQTEAMLAAAAADGIILTGSGWRSSQRQAELRVINGCPDVYDAPASACRVPTARPGQSNHERGLAIDFDSCDWNGWLFANAGRYGFSNLPSECWHWSVDGT
ncbi:MAG: hypothetical protein EDR02_11875 [Actinobacteria bacterium]|nr:MAG: hypothetical protein EDR02_11875 [Actinomycetota bacterium]RIK07155.1 MAG: hypothetical protein DCC48_05065 [Acidobacteriota bacterium]